MVCKLQKSLYGLKHAPRQWYNKFDNFMSSNGFLRCQADYCCYIKRYDGSYIIFSFYIRKDTEKVHINKKRATNGRPKAYRKYTIGAKRQKQKREGLKKNTPTLN